ncbi:hypothetical protein MPH_12058 [Macrophomina phaseolina MS6]|uniref:Uncharacterized protein n=1 Tax=Macrophomina phaseolina (strain MS6) TaxID=1126212 RepID=K2RL14_MACPH|nr:hypothetical protein MPH_12058 [Macrophomina phaseolina MS6]
MSSFAPPISRDGFVYHGQLFADAGNLNRHPRASEAEITALLRPEKPAKDQKDKVGHWYIAQLMHYGLPPTQNKNAAKVRLLDALNNKTLKVPPEVKKLEAALKKEYDAANRKAKAEMKGKTAEPENSTPARKRKRDEGSGAIATATPAASKRTKAAARATSARTNMRKETPAAVAMAAPRDRPNAPATGQTKPNATAASQNQSNASATPQTQPKPSVTPRNKPNTTATPQTSKSNAAAISRNKSKPSATPQDKPNAAPKPKKAVYSSKKGTYILSVPLVVARWPTMTATPKSLKMLLCPEGNKLWGSFTFGPFSGVFHFNENQRGHDFRFAWRATDASDGGQVKFTTGLGDMRFVDDKRVDGTFYNLCGYRCAFEGKLQGGERQCPRDALSFEHEWEDYGLNNGWFGPPPVKVPDGEQHPPGQYARSATLSALKSAETRYLPEDPRDSPPKSSARDLAPPTKSTAAKTQGTSVDSASRRVSYTQPGGDFYNNSPSAMTPVFNVMDIGHITGIYDVQCPAIEDNFLESQNNLKLLLCRETRSSRTWGAFHFPPFFGVIQMTPGPADYSPISVTLGWRARDGETGAIRFGRGCNGTMEFPEPGVIEGRLFGLYGEAVEFWGRRRPGPKNCGHSPDHFMEEWNSFPAEIYGEKKGNESDSELYDRNGNPNPRGRYSDLFERSFRS